jgi:hypothetical protein
MPCSHLKGNRRFGANIASIFRVELAKQEAITGLTELAHKTCYVLMKEMKLFLIQFCTAVCRDLDVLGAKTFSQSYFILGFFILKY